MPTTKVRPKTPMKNKTAEWRRQSRVLDPETGKMRRVGRMFRNIRQNMGMGKGYPHELFILLMKHAGIATPVFDARLEAVKEKSADLKNERENAIMDVVPEGV